VAIGNETATFVVLIVGSGKLTAAWLFEVIQGFTGESRVPRRDGAGWEDREKDRQKERNREAG